MRYLEAAAKARRIAYREHRNSSITLRETMRAHLAAGIDRAVIVQAGTQYGQMTGEAVRQILDGGPPRENADLLDLVQVASGRGHTLDRLVAATDDLAEAMWRAVEGGLRPAAVVEDSGMSEQAGYDYLALRAPWRELQGLFRSDGTVQVHRRLRNMYVAVYPLGDPLICSGEYCADSRIEAWLERNAYRVLGEARTRLVAEGWECADAAWGDLPALRVAKKKQ